MRISTTAIALVCLSGTAAAAPAPQYTFSFTVQVDDASPVALDASLAPGSSQTLQATEHLKVEIAAPASIDEAATTIVKLIDDSSGKPVVLHTARRVGPVATVRSFGYTVCRGVTTFQSPLRAAPSGCHK